MARSTNRRNDDKPDQQPPAATLDVDDVPAADIAGGGDAVPQPGDADPNAGGGDEGSGKRKAKAKGKAKRARQGDDKRPICPCCSTDEKLVLMEADSTLPLFTWYSCPNRASKKNPKGTCPSARVKVPRPEQHQLYANLRERRHRAGSIADR